MAKNLVIANKEIGIAIIIKNSVIKFMIKIKDVLENTDIAVLYLEETLERLNETSVDRIKKNQARKLKS